MSITQVWCGSKTNTTTTTTGTGFWSGVWLCLFFPKAASLGVSATPTTPKPTLSLFPAMLIPFFWAGPYICGQSFSQPSGTVVLPLQVRLCFAWDRSSHGWSDSGERKENTLALPPLANGIFALKEYT